MTPSSNIIRYAWQGKNRTGQNLSGVLYGVDKDSVRAQLAQRGIVAQRIHPSKEPLRKSIRSDEVTRFLQELTTLYDAGVPLLRIFDVLLHSQENLAFRNVIQTLRVDVERGESLHGALRHHPRVFDDLTCNLVESGETAGRLTEILRNIIYTQERRQQLISQIKTALTYPIFVIMVALVVWSVVLVWVVPVFEGIYKNAGQKLPFLTQILLDTSYIMRSQGWWIMLMIAVFFIFLWRWKNDSWLYWVDRFKLRMPIFGRLLKIAWHAQFSRILVLLYQSGVPLYQALLICSRTINNRIMSDAIVNCTQDILNGHSLSLAMARHDIFEQSLIQRIQIGEESGALTTMLTQHASYNEFLVEQSLKRLSTLIEPVLIVILGGIVAVMLIALYLPILNLGSVLR